MDTTCTELIELSEKEPKLKNRKIKLTNVVAANFTDSNFNLRVEEELKSKLATILNAKAELILSGEHVISGWLNTVKPSEEHVFKFIVVKLGQAEGCLRDAKLNFQASVLPKAFQTGTGRNGIAPTP